MKSVTGPGGSKGIARLLEIAPAYFGAAKDE
jgi:hypothetical protein